MKRLTKTGIAVTCLLAVIALGGCQGGASSTLMTLDVMQQAAIQAKIGVRELQATALADAQQAKVNFLKTLEGDLKRLAAGDVEAQKDPDGVALAGVRKLAEFWDNNTEQVRRINVIADTASDNLDFAVEQGGAQRAVVLYTSDVETQWKTWISNEATAKLNKLKAQAAGIPIAPGPTATSAAFMAPTALESLLTKLAAVSKVTTKTITTQPVK
jgi:hypothetical protein